MVQQIGGSEPRCAPDLPESEAIGHHPDRRISIVGATGSGKTRLALKLAEATGVPIFHLDELRYAANGELLSDAEFRAVVCGVIDHDAWIIDGHYRSVRDLIWRKAGKIIWMDYPIHLVLRRLLMRYLRKRDGQVAATIAPQAPAPAATAPATPTVSWLHRVRRFSRAIDEKRQYAVLLADPAYAGAKIVRFTHPDQAAAHIAAMVAGSRKSRAPSPNRRDDRLQIVELFGFPGTGKTTLVRRLAEELDCQTRKDLSRSWANLPILHKSLYALRGLADLRNIVAAAALAYDARWLSSQSFKRLLRLVARKHWMQTRKGILLLDQGGLQDVWAMLFGVRSGAVSERAIKRLVAALYRGTQPTIVYLDASPELAAIRIARRVNGKSRLDLLPQDDASEQLRQAQGAIQKILASADALGFTIINLNASAERSVIAQSAISQLREHGF